MESGFANKQGVIWTTSNVFRTMQLARNILENDKQHFLEVTLWRSIGKLHGWLCYTHQNDEGTQGMND